MEPEPDQYIQLTFFSTFLPLDAMPTLGFVGAILLVVLLLVASALISGSEVAFFSLSPADLMELKKEDSPASRRIVHLKGIPRVLLATILISNNFINIAIVILSDFILRLFLPVEICESWARRWLEGINVYLENYAFYGQVIHFGITVLGVTFLLVLFGEVAPKVYARFNNISLARLMSGPLVLLAWGFSPISSIMVRWTKALEKNIHDRTSSKITTSREDIDEAIELTVRNEQGAKQEMDILKSIIKFGDVTVKQIMRSRVDVIAVDFRVSYSDLIQTVKESGFSRIPVFDNDFDNITGVLYAKDLLEFINEEEKFEWQALIRTDVFYVPEAKKINELLKEFQERKQHMAIVVDEYGGCSGIVTLEDIMEEVIGDIKDEFDDDEELEYKKLDENNFIFEGKTLLNDLCRVIGVDTTTFDELRGDSDSIAGLILETTGQIPELETELDILNFKMKVIATNKRRIEKVKLTILPFSSTTIEES